MKPFNNQKSNPLISTLSLLNVRYTNEYTNKYYNEHPYKYNLFGLSKMLTYYGVSNMGIKLTNKEDLYSLETPFVAHIGNDFITVEKVSQKDISYYWRNKKLTIPIKDFLDMWSGIILVVEADEKSVEPDYEQHKREYLANSLPNILLLLAGIILFGTGLFYGHTFYHCGLTFLLIINLIGIYINYLLVQKQLHIHSSVGDKICSLFSQSDCNNVLDSDAAKFLGIIGWSELGLSYFLSNTFVLLFTPNLLSYLVFINILVLPYSFWSIWYQKYRAKTWCPLCLIVQLLFWLLFATSIIFRLIQIPNFVIIDILFTLLIYGMPLLVINKMLSYQITSQKLTDITQKFNSLKMNDKIFYGLLKEQTFYCIDKNTSTIILGNPNARNTITVFSNPHCEPCANMHKKIEKLLKDTNNQYCVQYILSSFNDTLNSSCEFLLYINKTYPKEERNRIFNEWFEKGKYDKDAFFKKYKFNTNNNISDEFQKHLEWKQNTKLQATPTIIFSGYELPEIYFQEIERLIFFTDLEIDPK